MPRKPRGEYPKEFIVALFPLELNCQLRYRINPGRGRVAGFVVQLEIEIDGQLFPVVRYDCAHGQPHRDILDASGHVIAKEWLQYRRDAALAHAHRDLRANWRQYREDFLRRMP